MRYELWWEGESPLANSLMDVFNTDAKHGVSLAQTWACKRVRDYLKQEGPPCSCVLKDDEGKVLYSIHVPK